MDILKTRKIERQIILATHNPNIVVNADAEQIIVFQKQPRGSKKCPFKSGGIENKEIRTLVTKILEGGEDAFKKRELRYENKLL